MSVDSVDTRDSVGMSTASDFVTRAASDFVTGCDQRWRQRGLYPRRQGWSAAGRHGSLAGPSFARLGGVSSDPVLSSAGTSADAGTRAPARARSTGADEGAGVRTSQRPSSCAQRLPSSRSPRVTFCPARVRPSARRGTASASCPQARVLSRVTVRSYQKANTASAESPSGQGRQAGSGSAAGTADLGVVALEIAGQEEVRVGDGGDALEAQLQHEPVLEGAPQSLDPTFGLGRRGR